jgi:predicted permease
MVGEWFRRAWYRLNRRRLEEALRREMSAHQDLMADPRRFGNSLRLREAARDVWGWQWTDDLGRDTRIAARMLRRSPGFTLTTVSSLAVGFVLIAATLAVVNAYLLTSLPYPQADRLYHVRYAPSGPWEPRGLSGLDWSTVQDVVEFPITSSGETYYLSDGPYARTARGLGVTRGFVQGLGVTAVMGRTLVEADWARDSDAVAMIGHALWRDRYGADQAIVGRQIRVETEGTRGAAVTLRIVGILPPGFYFGRDSGAAVDLMTPLKTAARTYMVRLRAGVPVPIAERRITEAVRDVATDLPADWTGAHLESARERYVAGLRPVLVAIALGAGLVLALVWTNVAVLTLLRTMRRQKEMAVRVALGSGRGHLARMLALEMLLVCLAALGVGLTLAHLALQSLGPLIEERLGRPAPGGASAMSIDTTVVLLVGGAGVIVALSLSFLPLLGHWQGRLADVLGRDHSSTPDRGAARRMRSVLVVVEIAITLVLLAGGGLMLRSVVGMVRSDLGFQPEHLIRSRVVLRGGDYADAAEYARFYDEFSSRLRSATGAPVVFTSWPFFIDRPTQPIEIDGREGDARTAGFVNAGAGYFATAGITVSAGRDFTAEDVRSGAAVAVVSQTLAARLWPQDSAIGRQLRGIDQTPRGSVPGPWRTVVGVAADVRQEYLDTQVADVYYPLSPLSFGRFGTFYLRTNQSAASLVAAVRTAAAAVDPHAMVDDPTPVTDQNQALEGARFVTAMASGIAAVGMLLAVIGIYGVTAYSVQQRTREVAIRMALGATAGSIRRLLLKNGAAVLAIGLGLGVLGALGFSTLLEHWLYGVPARDPGTLMASSCLLALAVLLAAWWPTRGVSQESPSTALKEN